MSSFPTVADPLVHAFDPSDWVDSSDRTAADLRLWDDLTVEEQAAADLEVAVRFRGERDLVERVAAEALWADLDRGGRWESVGSGRCQSGGGAVAGSRELLLAAAWADRKRASYRRRPARRRSVERVG